MDTSAYVMLESARMGLNQYVEGLTKAVLLGLVKTINQDIVQSQGSSSWRVHVEVGDVYKEGDPLFVAVVDKAKGGDIVSSIRRMDDKLKVMSYLKEKLNKSGGEGGIVTFKSQLPFGRNKASADRISKTMEGIIYFR